MSDIPKTAIEAAARLIEPTGFPEMEGEAEWKTITRRMGMKKAQAALSAALPYLAGVAEDVIRAAYVRGANWHAENGTLDLVQKAAADYADCTLGDPAARPSPSCEAEAVERRNLTAEEHNDLIGALLASGKPVSSSPDGAAAVCDPNGRRWRVEHPEWMMQPEGNLTAAEAERICKTTAAALARSIPKASADGVAALREALEPFARVAEYDIGEAEHNSDKYRPMDGRYAIAGALTVGHFRAALSALDQSTPKPSADVAALREGEKLWCESCGEAEQKVHAEHAGLCTFCWKEQGSPK